MVMSFVGQKYNYAIGIKDEGPDLTSFCSELVTKAYEKFGIAISQRSPTSVLPSDLETVFRTNEWMDITSEARVALSEGFRGVDRSNEEHEAEIFKLNYLQFRRTYLTSKLENARCAHKVMLQSLWLQGMMPSEHWSPEELASLESQTKIQLEEAKSAARELLALYWDSDLIVIRQLKEIKFQLATSEIIDSELNELIQHIVHRHTRHRRKRKARNTLEELL
ncbi:MAG: hypothetical protein HWD57_19265 [Candidatus Accumulibacter cognatus]|uniref:Uncharacterized protein n=1 Tax=Candidatus Accumulibacter cognatus TaxID=2954383 RepID=A0A7D5SA58_9PROT|nr:MAG: hypothetical protein HWD57_19265 [Candidatus Accumulibacter cognatus]